MECPICGNGLHPETGVCENCGYQEPANFKAEDPGSVPETGNRVEMVQDAGQPVKKQKISGGIAAVIGSLALLVILLGGYIVYSDFFSGTQAVEANGKAAVVNKKPEDTLKNLEKALKEGNVELAYNCLDPVYGDFFAEIDSLYAEAYSKEADPGAGIKDLFMAGFGGMISDENPFEKISVEVLHSEIKGKTAFVTVNVTGHENLENLEDIELPFLLKNDSWYLDISGTVRKYLIPELKKEIGSSAGSTESYKDKAAKSNVRAAYSAAMSAYTIAQTTEMPAGYSNFDEWLKGETMDLLGDAFDEAKLSIKATEKGGVTSVTYDGWTYDATASDSDKEIYKSE